MAEFRHRNVAFRFVANINKDSIAGQSYNCAEGNFSHVDDGIVLVLLKEFSKADIIKAIVVCRRSGLNFIFCHGKSYGDHCMVLKG